MMDHANPDHWAARYIGQPASDCWALARRVWAERWGLMLPAVPTELVDDPRAARRMLAAGTGAWQGVEAAREGDAVLMAKGQRPCHIGVWIEVDGLGMVLHWTEVAGVIATAPLDLARLGFRIHGFWRHDDIGGPR